MLIDGKPPEIEPSRMPAIIAAGIVGVLLAVLWVIIGVKGGAIPALVNMAAVLGTYKFVRKTQLEINK